MSHRLLLKPPTLSEERTDLPDLESRCPREESEVLARDFRRAKMFVPTRSASSAVGKGLPQTAAALMDVSSRTGAESSL